MRKLNFNKQGLLVPDSAISTDLDTIEKYFVADFPKSKTRQKLFENLMIFNETLQNEVFPWYEQWINGSFVTRKQNPKDLDVVVFLDNKVYETREKKLMQMIADSFDKLRIDVYFVSVYPTSHPLFPITQINRNDWFEFFTTTKSENRKGFLKLNFERKIETP